MSKAGFKRISPHYAVVILTLLVVVINSCRKENTRTNQSPPAVISAKEWYENTYPVQKNSRLVTQGIFSNVDLSQWLKPNWLQTTSYIRDNKNVIEIPIDPNSKFSFNFLRIGNKRFKKTYTKNSFLILNDGKNYSAYVMTIIADSAYLKNDLSKLNHNTYKKHDDDFSGVVLYFTPKGQYLNGYRYKNGQLVSSGAVNQTNGNKKIQSLNNDNLKLDNLATNCLDWFIDYFDTDGNLIYSEYIGTTCDSADDNLNDVSVPSNPCGSTSPPIEQSINGKPLVVDNIAPPGGGMNPPASGPCNAAGGSTSAPVAETPPPADPCTEKATVSAHAANATVSNQTSQVYSKLSTSSYEYGGEQKLQSLTGSTYLNTAIRTDNQPDSFNFNFTWDSSQGFTVGFVHDHPGGTAPDPDDVFQMAQFVPKVAMMGGAAGVKTYRSKVSVTVVTKTGNYVVTVTDWTAFQKLYNAYDQDVNGFDAQYISSAQTHQNDFAYALLSVFGSSINLYKAPVNSTVFQPLQISGNAVIIKQCP